MSSRFQSVDARVMIGVPSRPRKMILSAGATRPPYAIRARTTCNKESRGYSSRWPNAVTLPNDDSEPKTRAFRRKSCKPMVDAAAAAIVAAHNAAQNRTECTRPPKITTNGRSGSAPITAARRLDPTPADDGVIIIRSPRVLAIEERTSPRESRYASRIHLKERSQLRDTASRPCQAARPERQNVEPDGAPRATVSSRYIDIRSCRETSEPQCSCFEHRRRGSAQTERHYLATGGPPTQQGRRTGRVLPNVFGVLIQPRTRRGCGDDGAMRHRSR